MTKREQGMYENYKRTEYTELYQVYGSCSKKKWEALRECKVDQSNHAGVEGHICTWNRYGFTYAYKYIGDKGENRLRYHTATNVYDFEIA